MNTKKQILLVDDSGSIAETLVAYLQKEGFEVVYAKNGIEALDEFAKKKFDLILLDWMMPQMSGPEVIKELRTRSNVPILMISARSDEADIVVGLDYGADEYITKPFGPRELVARVKAMFRRLDNTTDKHDVIKIGPLQISFTKRQVLKNNKQIDLTPIELRILEALLNKNGDIVSRDFLMENALLYENAWSDRTLDTHIKNLRKKLENEKYPDLIKTVRGIGFKFSINNNET